MQQIFNKFIVDGVINYHLNKKNGNTVIFTVNDNKLIFLMETPF